MGESKLEKGMLSGEYIQHYDAYGNRAGTTEVKEETFGNDLVLVHSNSDGDEVGKSRREEGAFMMNSYTNHTGANSLHVRSEQLLSLDSSVEESVREEPSYVSTEAVEMSPLAEYLFVKLGLGIVIGIVLAIITGEFINAMISGFILAFVGKFLLKMIYSYLSKSY